MQSCLQFPQFFPHIYGVALDDGGSSKRTELLLFTPFDANFSYRQSADGRIHRNSFTLGAIISIPRRTIAPAKLFHVHICAVQIETDNTE